MAVATATVVADLIDEFGRERARADASDVGLGNADDPFDVARADPGADARTTRDRVG